MCWVQVESWAPWWSGQKAFGALVRRQDCQVEINSFELAIQATHLHKHSREKGIKVKSQVWWVSVLWKSIQKQRVPLKKRVGKNHLDSRGENPQDLDTKEKEEKALKGKEASGIAAAHAAETTSLPCFVVSVTCLTLSWTVTNITETPKDLQLPFQVSLRFFCRNAPGRSYLAPLYYLGCAALRSPETMGAKNRSPASNYFTQEQSAGILWPQSVKN